jgi:uncharacterized protein
MQAMKIKRWIPGCLVLAILFFARAVPCEGDFSTAWKAYGSGDYKTAFREFLSIAEEGDAKAQRKLGLMYSEGQGVPQDYAQAAHWYRKAADQGNAYAQTKLGFLYSLGQGVPQDYVQAHLWFNLAAAQGDEQAPKARDITAELMTPGQVAEAQRLARNWKPITSPDVIPNGIPTDRTNAHPLSPSPSENLGPSPALLRQVQEGLIALGYEAGPPDGILRPTTWAAIRAFQADVGLPVDGKIGEAILDRIK